MCESNPMLYDGAQHDLPLSLHSSNRGVNVILHEAQACVKTKSMLYSGVLQDLPLFVHSSGRGVKGINLINDCTNCKAVGVGIFCLQRGKAARMIRQ